MEAYAPVFILVAFLILCSAFFSGSETALFSLSAIQRDRLGREETKSSRRILALLSEPRRLIVTLLMGNELVNVSLSAVLAGLFTELLPGNQWAPIVIGTGTLLMLGEITPKSVAISRPMVWSRFASLPLSLFALLITPVRIIIHGIVVAISSIFGTRTIGPEPISEAEFRQLAQVGAEEGTLEEEEADMIIKVFNLAELRVEKIMTPRTEIIAFESTPTVSEALDEIRSQRYSRLPIYDDDLDNIIGVLHVNDLLRHSLGTANPTLGEIARNTIFVPVAMKGDELLQQMKQNQTHMAIVIDEYGGTEGLVTLDDVLGEIFGELPGERAEEEFSYVRTDEGDLIVAGGLPLDEFSELVQIPFESEHVETIGGMVFQRFGHLPKKGEWTFLRGLRFTVLSVRENRIWRLRIATARTAS